MFNHVEGVLAKLLRERDEDRARVDELYQWPLQLHQVTDRLSAVERSFVTKAGCTEELTNLANAMNTAIEDKLNKLRGELSEFETGLRNSEAHIVSVESQFHEHVKEAFQTVDHGYTDLKLKIQMMETEARTTAAAAAAMAATTSTPTTATSSDGSIPLLQASALMTRVGGLEETVKQSAGHVQWLMNEHQKMSLIIKQNGGGGGGAAPRIPSPSEAAGQTAAAIVHM